jgi:hypothetical protein
MLGTVFFVFLLAAPGFSADRDPDTKSLKGIPHGHKHAWAVIGGTALGAGLGAIPGGASNVFKGALIGGSGASALYLAKHHGQEGPWSYVITNAGLVAGIGWAICDCAAGGGAGALVGGGGTALVQAFHTKHRTLAKMTGATGPGNSPPQSEPPPPPQPQPQGQPPQNNPAPQNQQPQDNPAQPQNQPPQDSVPQPQPQSQPPQGSSPQPQPQQNQQTPPPQNLPDAPQPQDQ